ncbi:MAG TPA: DUF4279 domain-containing protein [Thermoanaerobaculaceae bacterium]|nr:DUF4279 domain-containing protein [Thermoanaerobaculaceae bacterium]
MSEEETRPRIRAGLTIIGEHLDPDECTAAIGIVPTAAGRKGQVPSNRRHPLPWGFWRLAVDQRSTDLDESVASLLDLIRGRTRQIRGILSQYGFSATVECWIDLFGESLAIELSNKTIQAIGELGANLSIDVSDYRD